jgi:hypothetical protein
VPSDTGNHYYIGIARMDRVAGQETITSGMITELLKEFRRVDTDDIADDAVTLAKVAANAVDTDQLVDDAVTTAKIVNAAITTAKIADVSINNDKLADNSVDGDNIIDGSVNTSELANYAVTNNKLAGNAVNTSHIVDGAITPSKLSAPYYFMRIWADDSMSRTINTEAGGLNFKWECGDGDQFQWEIKIHTMTFVHEFAPKFKARLLGRVGSANNGYFRLGWRYPEYGGGGAINWGASTAFFGTVYSWQECDVTLPAYTFGATVEVFLAGKGTDPGASPPASLEFYWPVIWAQNV